MSPRPVKPHASGDPFLRKAANDILSRHATFPRVKWEDALTAIAETLRSAAADAHPNPETNK